MLNAMHLGDVINDLIYQIRPFEVNKGETDRVFREMVDGLCEDLRNRKAFEIEKRAPKLAQSRNSRATSPAQHLQTSSANGTSTCGARIYLNALQSARETMNTIEVDRTRVKPVVKITGEFWAQTHGGRRQLPHVRFPGARRRTGDGGADRDLGGLPDVPGEGTCEAKWPVNRPHRNPKWYEVKKHLANYIGLRKKLMGHRRWARRSGTTSTTGPSRIWAALRTIWYRRRSWRELAHPFYNQFARGGEGHLEVGKNVYYTVHQLCHMVLALKPFGCMPSSQSDGVQSAVINKFKDMIFLPIETSGEGEVNAHSRVQMALGEAKVKAKTEFEQCLKSTGKTLDDIREYIAEHPELRRPFYHVPHREGHRRNSSAIRFACERAHGQEPSVLAGARGCRAEWPYRMSA